MHTQKSRVGVRKYKRLDRALIDLLYNQGNGVPQDYAKVRKWFRKVAELGDDAIAQYNLGVLYRDGLGGAQDYVEARKWFLKAAEQGIVEAQYNLGYLYYNGQGVAPDNVIAYAWYDIAASQGDDDARHNLDIVVEKLDTDSLVRAQLLSDEYFKRYVEPFQ